MNKELENSKQQREMKNTILEIRNLPQGINNRLDDTEEQISELE